MVAASVWSLLIPAMEMKADGSAGSCGIIMYRFLRMVGSAGSCGIHYGHRFPAAY